MDAHELSADALVQHTEADEHHPEMGWDFVPSFDENTMADCQRVVEDVYRLMGFTLDEWLGLAPTATGTGTARGGRDRATARSSSQLNAADRHSTCREQPPKTKPVSNRSAASELG